jgi:hypothetical protein
MFAVIMVTVLCGTKVQEAAAQKVPKSVNRGDVQPTRDSALSRDYFLSRDDLAAFRAHRPKAEVLKDVQWRGNFVMASRVDEKNIYAISYQLFSNNPYGGGASVYAIFVDEQFIKFVKWFRGDFVDVPYNGSTWSRPKRIKTGNDSWLVRAAASTPANLSELEKEAREEARQSDNRDSSIDPGLTVVFLGLKATGVLGKPTERDYQRNLELRDQFNASRLELGMTPAQVEAIFKAKPLETGKVPAGDYQIYGSDESSKLGHPMRFTNVLVLFQKSKATFVYGTWPGDGWRSELEWLFLDLPVKKPTDSGVKQE